MSSTDLELRPTVVEPRTGETITLADAPHEQLVDVFRELEKREKAFREWRTAVEDELVRRQTVGNMRKKTEVVGDLEVMIDEGYTRKWDAEDLIETVSNLVAEGHLTIMDAQGLVRDEPKVDGRRAAALLNRVDGEALMELRKCFTWETRGRARVKITPVAQIEP